MTCKLYALHSWHPGVHVTQFSAVFDARAAQSCPKLSFQGLVRGKRRAAPELFAVIESRAKYRASRRCCMASETLRGLDESLLLQKLREHLEPYLAVVDLEHALLDRKRQRQDLGEPVADPRRVGERELGGKVLFAD